MKFGNRLKTLRLSEDMTQEELGRLLEKTKNSISQYETGKREPDLETLIILSEYFDVTLDYLLGKNDDPRTMEPGERYSAIIGERLRTIRASRNLSVSDVSKASNISEDEILKIEGGRNVNFVKVLEKLAQYYNVSVNYFLGIFDDPTLINTAPATEKPGPITLADWPTFLAQLPEDQAMHYQNTDYPGEEKIAIMEEVEKAKQRKRKKIDKLLKYTDEVIDDALIFAAFSDEQRKNKLNEN